MDKPINHSGRGALLAAVLLTAACRDGVSPERRANEANAASAAAVQLTGVGSIGPGPATPGGSRVDFDLDVASSLTGRVLIRDWAVVRADGSVGTLTVTPTDAETRITAVRDGSITCADPTHGVEVDGVGRLNSGGDSDPAGDEFLEFTVTACDEGPAESGADVLFVSLANGYTAGPDRLSSGDLAKSSDGGSPGNQPPTADFTPSCNELTCSFNSTSNDPDGTITAHSWDFGDGGTSPETNPSHSYQAEGTYTVTLTVTDDQGATSSASQGVTVTGPSSNQPPTADFTPSCSRLTCSFVSTSSDDGSIVEYFWDFGDGVGTSAEQNPSYTYRAGGTYSVGLAVMDDQGEVSVTWQDVTVAQPNQPPVVNAGPDETTLVGLLYRLNASFSDPDDAGPWSYTITWGDGSTSTGSTSSPGTISAGHAYFTILPRSFTIRVTVTDAAGASSSDTKVVTVLLL